MPRTNLRDDLNNDGLIGIADLGILANHYGFGTSGAQLPLAAAERGVGLNAIPEPATLALLALGLPMLRRRV